jgi:hypothetical protein
MSSPTRPALRGVALAIALFALAGCSQDHFSGDWLPQGFETSSTCPGGAAPVFSWESMGSIDPFALTTVYPGAPVPGDLYEDTYAANGVVSFRVKGDTAAATAGQSCTATVALDGGGSVEASFSIDSWTLTLLSDGGLSSASSMTWVSSGDVADGGSIQDGGTFEVGAAVGCVITQSFVATVVPPPQPVPND